VNKRWQLNEEQLKQLLLVSEVRIGVRKTCIDWETEYETGESADSNRIQETAESGEHHQIRKPQPRDGDA
jgi:hypothetical protein